MSRLTVTVLEILVFLSLAILLAGCFGQFHFLLDLASHFRIHAAVTLLVGGLLLWKVERYFWACPGLLFGTFTVMSVFPYLYSPRTDPSPKTGPYRVLSANLLTTNRHYDEAIRTILDLDPDIIALLETDRTWIEKLKAELANDWPHFICKPQSDNFGIAMFSRIPWSNCETVSFSSLADVYSIDAQFDDENLRIIATHPLPPMNDVMWRDRTTVFEAIARLVKDDSRKTIVVGDLNCTPWSPCFAQFTEHSGLRDSARGHSIWPSWSPVFSVMGLPIDHALVSSNVEVLGRFVGPHIGSDHRPVIIDFQ